MRRAAKIDANQSGIVRALRSVGATCQSIAAVGKGSPDLIVGYRGTNFLMEIKDGSLVESKKRLTPMEQDWHARWRGMVHVVGSEEEALKIIGAIL